MGRTAPGEARDACPCRTPTRRPRSSVRVVWAPRAQQRLQEIVGFIAADQPAAAERVLERVLRAARTLGEQPNLGRRGRLRGTRELIVGSTPYLLTYRVR